MNVTDKRKYEREQKNLEIQLDFWSRQQEHIKDDTEYWHYIEGRRQALNERLDKIRHRLKGARW